MRPSSKGSVHIRPGQSGAAGRYDREDGLHTWPVLDRVEILAMSEGTRTAAYLVLETVRGPIVEAVAS